MKRYIIPVIIVLVLALGVTGGCSSAPSSEPTATKTPTTSELQAQVEALQEELNQLREQKKAETIRRAEAYYAVIKYGAGSCGDVTLKVATVESIMEALQASGKFWNLIKATEDTYLISLCQPNEAGIVTCRYSQVKAYAEGKYRELMSEYHSQQYIDAQLALAEQSMEESAIQEPEEKIFINNVPFTYAEKGNGRTPTFYKNPTAGSYIQCKLTFTVTWDGDISISWHGEETKPSLITMDMWSSTGISFGFPDSVEAGKTYEYIFNWNNPLAIYLNVENVPADGEWTITVSQMDSVTPRPKLDITVVIEYDGKCCYQVTSSSRWGSFWRTGSGNTSRVYENIGLPFHCRAQRDDEGVSPLVLKFLYNGEVVAQDTAIGEDDEAWVYWEGPQ